MNKNVENTELGSIKHPLTTARLSLCDRWNRRLPDETKAQTIHSIRTPSVAAVSPILVGIASFTTLDMRWRSASFYNSPFSNMIRMELTVTYLVGMAEHE